jgi:hypothetical protein
MNDWVTIATFTYPHEAAILRGRLESEGIECNAKDENTVSANPFYSNAIGGVKIQVKESDVERANEIVKDYYYHTNGDIEVDPQEEYKPDEIEESSSEKIKCPVCGSEEVHQDKRPSQFNIIMVLLLGIPLIFPGKKKYHCFNCGSNFKEGQ